MPRKIKRQHPRHIVNLPLAYRDFFERGIKPSDNAEAEGAFDLYLDLFHHPKKIEALRLEHYGTYAKEKKK